MTQLKLSYIEKIKKALADSCFSLQDFNLDFPDSGDVLVIKFKYDERYSLSVYENERTEYINSSGLSALSSESSYRVVSKLDVQVKPGYHKSEEEWHLPNFDKLPSKIPDWCKCIKDELHIKYQATDDLEVLRKKLEEQLESLVSDPNESFNSSEVISINDKFDELFSKFESLQADYDLTKEELKSIKKDFEEFKSSAEIYPKGLWAKITNNKLVDIVATVLKSKEGRDFMLGEVKKLFSA